MKKVGLLLALALGCRGTTEPAPLAGNIYVLQTVAGESLPTTYVPNSVVTFLAYADTLALHEDGTGERRTVRQGDSPDERATDETMFHWVRSGSDIAITFDCPGLALCIQGPHLAGALSAGGKLTITQSTVNRVPLVYQWLFPPD